MKILIVDDEFYARKSIIKMIKEWDCSALVTGDVGNGIEAMNSIEVDTPDVILTDIRMPKMDGLDLCRNIKANYPDIFVVILTGYPDFEYARKAMEYNVKRYLLKPVKKEKLLEILEELKFEMASKSVVREHHTYIAKELDMLRMAAYVTGVIYGERLAEKKISDILGWSKEPAAYFLSVIKMYSYISDMVREELDKFIKSQFGEETFAFRNGIAENEWICIHFTFRSEPAEIEMFRKGSISGMKILAERIKASFNDKFCIGISQICRDTESLAQCYRAAKSVLNYRFMNIGVCLYEYSSGQIRGSGSFCLDSQQERLFYHELMNGRAAGAKKILDNILENVFADTNISVRSVQDMVTRLVTLMNNAREELDAAGQDSLPEHVEAGNMERFFTFGDVVTYLNSIIDDLCKISYRSENKKTNSDSIIDDLEKYVMENYHYDISLDILAKNRYFMNTSYLSRLFKSKTGKCFSDFLLDVRMEKAKEFLRIGELGIADVAALTGYGEPAYFISVFKKYYGETPGNYKAGTD